MPNARQFRKKLKNFGEVTVPKAIDFSIEEMGMFILTRVKQRTPIDTGLAKGNWQGGLNDDVRPVKDTDRTKTGLRARRKIYKQVSPGIYKNGRTVYVKNGVDSSIGPKSNEDTFSDLGDSESQSEGGYIIQLDNGKSKQAPNGMVGLAMANSKRISKKALKATFK